MVKGYAGKILRVDLSSGKIGVEEPTEDFYRRYIGGQGFIGYYLLKEVPKGADPLGPENLLIFAGGAITGIPVTGAGRSSVGGKSPLTGGYGEADAGGFFGAELKHAATMESSLRAIAPPVYLWVHDGEAELRPADHLWVKPRWKPLRLYETELGDQRIRLAMIGPGARNGSHRLCDARPKAFRWAPRTRRRDGPRISRPWLLAAPRSVEVADDAGLKEWGAGCATTGKTRLGVCTIWH
jgi:aldehyde:ferredoxin oxidoreductase